MKRSPSLHRLRAHPGALRLLLGLFAGVSLPSAARAVDFPRAVVVCEAPRQACHDRQGASINLTRPSSGPGPANQLLAQLSGSPPQGEFRLSGGLLCHGSQQFCWDDGWGRRKVSPLLSRQIFGPSSASGPGQVSGAAPQAPPAGERICKLVQRGATVFSGSCRLYRQNETIWTYYVVQMENGKLYRFQRRANLLVLNDATGNWPVLISDRGTTVQFRWANLLLEISRPLQARAGPPGSTLPASPTPRSTGESGQELLDALFP